MPILTSGYVDLAITTARRVALVGSATGTGSAFAQYEKMARATVASKAAVKGYSIATNSTNDMVRLLCLGQWYFWAAGYRKGMEVPPTIKESMSMLEDVEKGMPIAGLTPDTEDGIGGTKASATTGTSTSGRAQRFSRAKLDPYW